MMLLLATVALAATLAVLTGGKMSRLEQMTLRRERWLLGLLLLQLTVARVPMTALMSDRLAVYGFWAIPGLLLCLVLVANRSRPGLGLAAAGVALNLVVVLSNGGMPVQAIGTSVPGDDIAAMLEASWLHVAVDSRTKLLILADILPIPGPEWLRGIVSLGDVMLAAGVGYFLFVTLHGDRAADLETG